MEAQGGSQRLTGSFLRRSALGLAVVISLFFASPAHAEYGTFGLFAGASFPKLAFLKLDLNFSDPIGAEIQASLGVYWSIQQADLLYYLHRGREWSWYLGGGVQNWNFYGFSQDTNYSGIILGQGSNATAATVPFGFVYYDGQGMALNLNIGGSMFTAGPDNIRGKIIPEAQLAIGFYL
jgi:hypothetical protein